MRQKQKDKGLIETLPMGYYKDRNTNKVCIDEEAADIIREIFSLYIHGYGMTAIAKQLNARGIRSPEFYEALLKEDLERERTGTLFSCEAHPPELDEEYLDMLAAEAEEELKSEGRLEELERKYCLEEADSQK